MRSSEELSVRRKIVAAVFMLGVIFSAGCGSARPSKYYQLTIPGNSAAAAPADPYPVTLLLGTLTASHLYREDHIIYGGAGEKMGVYEYERWIEPPTEMIEEVLFRQLRTSGRYRAVYSLHSSTRGDYVIHGHLYDFKEVAGSGLAARLTLELALRDTKTGLDVWNHFYSHDEPAASKDVSAVVSALNQNVQRGLEECRASLDQYFASHPVTAPAQ
jgi:ABC-type uncharacterized transport system auxiliary subunit